MTGPSMMPLLKPGDEVLIESLAFQKRGPQPDDVVVARHPYRADLHLIKRVIDVSEGGDCHLQGDYPANSTDSRSFGLVPAHHILGRVICRFGRDL